MKMSIVLHLFCVQCCFSCCSLMWQQHGRHGNKQTSWSERLGLYLAGVWTHPETLHLKLQAILDNTKHPLHNILAGTNCWLQKQPMSAGLSGSRCPLSPLPSGSIAVHVMDYWTIIFCHILLVLLHWSCWAIEFHVGMNEVCLSVYQRCLMEIQSITRVIAIHHETDLNVCPKYHCNPSNSCWVIS